MTPEQLSRISDKLDNLLGEAPKDATQIEGAELLNEEGLPIIDITEPVTEPDTTATHSDAGTFTIPETPVTPLPTFALPDEERAREQAEMDRLFDLLEAEEEVDLARDAELEQQRAREELERRKANAAKELERLRKAKEMQRRMGKALLGGLSDEAPAAPALRTEERDGETVVQTGTKSGKKVAFAEGTAEEKSATPTPAFRSVHAGQPMKFQVVERRPSKPSPVAALIPQPSQADSDDESAPGSPVPADSDDGGAIHSDRESPLTSEVEASDDELDEDPVLEDDVDIDEAAHQREVALAYYEKRATLGRDTARAMSAHTHEPHSGEQPGDNEWDQPDVPLEATLSHPAPKSGSRFKTSRIKKAFNTSVPSSMPSTSLGASILPEGSSVKGAVRLGKFEDGKLLGGEDGESGSDLEDNDESVAEFMNALRRGDVTNAGTIEGNTDALMVALTAAYGGPVDAVKESLTSSSAGAKAAATATTSGSSVQPPASLPASAAKPKTSRFKIARNLAPRVSSYDSPATTPLATDERSSPKLPTGQVVVERTRPTVVPSVVSPTPRQAAPPPASTAKGQPLSAPSTVAPTVTTSSASSVQSLSPPSASTPADKPWVRAPERGAQMPSMIVDSPSFAPPPTSSRPQRPPTIVSTSVFERKTGPARAESAQPTQSGVSAAPAKVSRFKANRS
ncbi:hypothetical protein PENSPDRAFT_664089 [Peniophora sp. CONT]|nr:hypothetical protein PENSPDRAFT_664089 [Peniophora sp. CONT]